MEKPLNDLPPFTSIALVSKNLFTTSGKYEFVLGFLKDSAQFLYDYKLYNEDNEVLYDFGEYDPFRIVNGKLLASKADRYENGTQSYRYRFYSLQGNDEKEEQDNSSIKQYVESTNINSIIINPYPVPANSWVVFEYDVQKVQLLIIRSVTGKEIDHFLLDPHQ